MRIQMKILAILGITSLLLLGTATPALAFNPQPEPPGKALVNKLNSVANVLEAVDRRLEAVMTDPPEPNKPGRVAIILQLKVMTKVLEVQLGRVEAVMQDPPDPQTPGFREALAAVRSVASRITERASIPPEPWRELPGVMEALQGVQQAADEIVEITAPSDVIP